MKAHNIQITITAPESISDYTLRELVWAQMNRDFRRSLALAGSFPEVSVTTFTVEGIPTTGPSESD